MKQLNAGIAFFIELGMVFALGYWGFNASSSVLLSYVLGFGAPLLAILAWGTYAAPKSQRRLRQPWRSVFAIVLFGIAAVALYSVGQHAWAVALAVLALVNQMLILAWKQ